VSLSLALCICHGGNKLAVVSSIAGPLTESLNVTKFTSVHAAGTGEIGADSHTGRHVTGLLWHRCTLVGSES